MAPINIASQGPPVAAAHKFLSRQTPQSTSTPHETDLLRSIRAALRGSDTENVDEIHTATFFGSGSSKEPDLSWNARAAILSYGPVMAKKWSFEEEGEAIQWACLGQLEQSALSGAAKVANGAMIDPSVYAANRSSFGPFSRASLDEKVEVGPAEPVTAVFIFLRSIGKIYLMNGVDYTFSLPFIVRKAWPISPSGILVQRVLEPTEVEEARAAGDDVLPTIFSVTSPFSEATAVGLTSGILGHTLKDEDEHSTKPLKAIPATEMIVWTSHASVVSDMLVTVTVNVEKRLLSIWRYVYIKPKDAPVSSSQRRTPAPAPQPQPPPAAKRQSMPGNRRTSAMYEAARDRIHPMSPGSRSREVLPAEIEMPPLSSLPGMAPSLSSTATMASLVGAPAGKAGKSRSGPIKARRNSLSRNDLSNTLDRMALGTRLESDPVLAPVEHGRMKAAYWMECLLTRQISAEDAEAWRRITVSLFDSRFDGDHSRALIAICLPESHTMPIFSVAHQPDKSMLVTPITDMAALSATSIRATRENVWDLLVVKTYGRVSLLTHGMQELSVEVTYPTQDNIQWDEYVSMYIDEETPRQIVSVDQAKWGTAIVSHRDGTQAQITLDIYPQNKLTLDCFHLLALILPTELTFNIHRLFLERWSSKRWSTSENTEFECFSHSLFATFGLEAEDQWSLLDPWRKLGLSKSRSRFAEDRGLSFLKKPPVETSTTPPKEQDLPPHPMLAPLLYGLHTLAEQLRLNISRQCDLWQLVPLICRVASTVRPEWVDFWKRLLPDVVVGWPSAVLTKPEHLDDRIPVWPHDISAILYGRVSTPNWNAPWHDVQHIVTRFSIKPSLEYGVCDPLHELHELSLLYNALSDGTVEDTQKRAENVIIKMVQQNGGQKVPPSLPLGVASPLREAARTCQLAPPGNWPLEAYRAVDRNDLATSATQNPDAFVNNGYRTKRQWVNDHKPREVISEIVVSARTPATEANPASSLDVPVREVTDVRFGQDRRIDEVSRLLCSSTVPSLKLSDRNEMGEQDQQKEMYNLLIRVAERTFAIPYGRAMFSFGSLPVVTQEAYAIPKMEFSVRFQPGNTLVTAEGKLSAESLSWGEFHNGVAAGLRISPTAPGVESSWIAFNKPSELSPEHAGFLLALGLTGHLKNLLTWHTFQYLTPKHELTSIGLLLGMAAANVGNSNQHVIKLIAVHTPALLPTPTVDLNVPLITQAAGMCGVGLLYLGTRNRRMAEVCLGQISRRDLTQPDLSNEHREAYTYASGLAFGMVMVGKGSNIPADVVILQRLSVLIMGDTNTLHGKTREAFDLNLTSPAASIAMGLMYLRTNQQSVANRMPIPHTIVELNAVPPTFLLVRTVARSLIMWNDITPSEQWLLSLVPQPILTAFANRQSHGDPVDDALELAYYNILSGGCFVIGLKYAGTAHKYAYEAIVKQFDAFSKLAHTTVPQFDHKIKRSAIRDGLNLISIALCMVMAGTGELTCLQRLRFAYGMAQQTMYGQSLKYGVNVAIHMSLGLLFLGGGRFTLGTSDAAIAAMITAFFPRFNQVSSDNRSYLQALRHMWVLAAEPRCLVARDVDSGEVVYLPVKIAMKPMQDGDQKDITGLITPTLIPDMDRLMSIRVDTPRYWPFYLDTAAHPRHKEALLRSQTLYVKRRTAFLSYTEDARGSRSLFVRSGTSSGNSATLDFPQLRDSTTHPAGDLGDFITSVSNDAIFLAFAEHFARRNGGRGALTPEEEIFQSYCHAVLYDSLLQDKPRGLQSHLTLYLYRTMPVSSRYFHLRMQDLRFATDFYGQVYERRFSGKSENNIRAPLIRETTLQGTLHDLDKKLDAHRSAAWFLPALRKYSEGVLRSLDPLTRAESNGGKPDYHFSAYLLRNCVPVSTVLVVLQQLAQEARNQCLNMQPPDGTSDSGTLDLGIKEVIHSTGNRMTTAYGSGWSVQSLHEVIQSWTSG